MKGRGTYSAVQLDEHHETTGNELRHRDRNRIEQKQRLHVDNESCKIQSENCTQTELYSRKTNNNSPAFFS